MRDPAINYHAMLDLSVGAGPIVLLTAPLFCIPPGPVCPHNTVHSTKLSQQWLCPRCVTKKRKSSGGKSPAGKKKAKGGGAAAAAKGRALVKEEGGGTAAAAGASKKRKTPSVSSGGGGAAAAAAVEGPGSAAKKAKWEWSESQEALLIAAVKKVGAGKWTQIAEDPEFDFEGKPGKALGSKWRSLSKRTPS